MSTSISRVLFLVVIVTLCYCRPSFAQDSKEEKTDRKTEAIKKMVDEKKYVFEVESVTPMKGGRRQLTPGNTLKILNDTIISDLPYFGRLYQGTIGETDGGIKFTSTDFEYTSKDRKKGGWDIKIRPKDSKFVQDMYLTVFENGTATLNLNCNDRQPISFDGYVEAPKQK